MNREQNKNTCLYLTLIENLQTSLETYASKENEGMSNEDSSGAAFGRYLALSNHYHSEETKFIQFLKLIYSAVQICCAC